MAKVTTVKWLENGWFAGVFHYGFCPDEKAWNREMKRLKEQEEYPTSAGRCTFFAKDDNHKACCIVTIQDGVEKTHTPVEVSGLMLHEAVHVFQFLKETIGEDNPGVEMEAYGIQHIYSNLMWEFEKTRCSLKDCDV